MRQGPLAGRYPAAAAMVIFALVPYLALSAALRAPQHVAAMLAAMPQEHERALGGWQAEWPTLAALIETIYAAGLRVSEATSLTLAAVARDPAYLMVRGKALPARIAPTPFVPNRYKR